MRRNKKVKKHSRCTMNSVNIVTLIVLSFLAVMVYWSQDAHCTELAQEIGKAEKEYKRLESDYQREISSWEELKTPDNLRLAFIRHGLDMGQPNQEQVIHMNENGSPEPGQMSVARIRSRRSRIERVASIDYAVRPRNQPAARANAGRAAARKVAQRR